MAQSTISQRLSFEGLEDITKRLAVMGETGQKAIEQIRTATGGSTAAFSQLSSVVNELQGITKTLGALGASSGHAAAGVNHLGHAVGGLNFEHTTQHLSLLLRGMDILDSRSIEIGQSLAHLGGVFTGVVGAIGTAVLGIGALSVAAAENTRTLVNQAAVLGISIEKLEGMRFAAAQVGVSQEDLNRGLDRLSANLGKAQEAQKKLADEAPITGEKNRIAVAKLALAVDTQNLSLDRNADKQRNLADAIRSATLAAEKSKDAFDKSSHSVEQAQITAEKAQIAYDKLKESFNTTGLSARDARSAQLDLSQAQLNAREAQEGVAAAEKKRKEQLEELGKAVEKIKQAEAAFTLAKKEAALESKKLALANDEEKLKIDEVRHAAEQAKSVFDKLKINIAPDRSQIEILEEFRDKLSKVTNEAERNSLAREAYGKGFQTLGAYIGIATDKMKEFEHLSHEFSFTPKDNEIADAKRLISAYETMKIALEGLKNAIGNIMGTNFDAFFDKVSHAIAANKDAIREFLTDMSASFARWSTALGNLVPPIVLIFKGLWYILTSIKVAFDDVAATMNRVFGTKFTGEDLIVGILAVRVGLTVLGAAFIRVSALIGGLVGGVVALGARIVAFGATLLGIGANASAGFIPLLAAFGPAGWLIIGFIAIIAAAITFKGAWGEVWDWFKGRLEEIKAGLKLLVLVAAEAAKMLGLTKSGAKELVQPGSIFDPTAAPPPAASPYPTETYDQRFARENPQLEHHQSGGRVGGSGSGDIVPARLEPGEFVVRKSVAQHIGGFLSALNSGMSRGFSMGGIVESLNSIGPSPVTIPSGGSAPRTGDDRALFHLTIGEKTFSGLSASKSTADEMLQYARRSNVLSIGKKQSWYGS